MSTRTLVLTREFFPHKVIEWDRALMMLFQGKIEVVEEYPDVIGTIAPDRVRDFRQVAKAYGHRFAEGDGIVIRTLSVVRLWNGVGSIKRGVKFSRINVFTRDGFRCQYCGAGPKKMTDLNYDHVIPRVQGGRTVWENIVTSCYPCNERKAHRTPEQAGMRLRKQPYKPKTLPMLGPRFDPKAVPVNWLSYIASFVTDETMVA